MDSYSDMARVLEGKVCFKPYASMQSVGLWQQPKTSLPPGDDFIEGKNQVD